MRYVSIAGVPPAPTLVAEATRRSGAVWVSADGLAPALLWHLWHDGRMYVVAGGAEQALPLTHGRALRSGRALVTVRSAASQAGRVVEWAAEVDVVEPGTPAWQEVAPLLAASRLNAVDAPGQLERWARESTVLRFCPVAAEGPAPGTTSRDQRAKSTRSPAQE